MSKTWQGQQGSNPRPADLESAALPTELYPCRWARNTLPDGPAQGVCATERADGRSCPLMSHRIPTVPPVTGYGLRERLPYAPRSGRSEGH